MQKLLTKLFHPCNAMVKNLIKIEDAYINTYHPDFMGGANSMFNVFDPSNYEIQQAKLKKLDKDERRLSFEDISDASSQKQQSSKKEKELFLNQMSQKQQQKPSTVSGLMSSFFGGGKSKQLQEEEDEQLAARLQELELAKYGGDQEYEISKYMQSNVKPIMLPSMPSSLRAAQEEACEKSPRSSMEIKIIKNLITSYFNVVRKNLNDIVPKTIIAMLVNKTKNQAQRELVA